MDIRCLKLLSGEEIIFAFDGHATVEGVRCIIANNPVAFHVMRDPSTGQPVTGFGDWAKLARGGQTHYIPVSAVLNMPVEPNEDLGKAYYQAMTGLVLPGTDKILLG